MDALLLFQLAAALLFILPFCFGGHAGNNSAGVPGVGGGNSSSVDGSGSGSGISGNIGNTSGMGKIATIVATGVGFGGGNVSGDFGVSSGEGAGGDSNSASWLWLMVAGLGV